MSQLVPSVFVSENVSESESPTWNAPFAPLAPPSETIATWMPGASCPCSTCVLVEPLPPGGPGGPGGPAGPVDPSLPLQPARASRGKERSEAASRFLRKEPEELGLDLMSFSVGSRRGLAITLRIGYGAPARGKHIDGVRTPC